MFDHRVSREVGGHRPRSSPMPDRGLFPKVSVVTMSRGDLDSSTQAEELDAFDNNIDGRIDVFAEFRGLQATKPLIDG
jgi:hypothetical protein